MLFSASGGTQDIGSAGRWAAEIVPAVREAIARGVDAVKRIESALTERDVAREASESALDAANAEAERLLSAARIAGRRAGEQRRVAMLARAHADAEVIRMDILVRVT